jgi:hypothetical protein
MAKRRDCAEMQLRRWGVTTPVCFAGEEGGVANSACPAVHQTAWMRPRPAITKSDMVGAR